MAGEIEWMRQRTVTTHDELWEVTFEATIPTGVGIEGHGATSAEGVIVAKWTQILRAAGVPAPKVRVRKLATSGARGSWDQWTPYEQGDIVTWHDRDWVATKPSTNRKPDSYSGRNYWALADAPEQKELNP